MAENERLSVLPQTNQSPKYVARWILPDWQNRAGQIIGSKIRLVMYIVPVHIFGDSRNFKCV